MTVIPTPHFVAESLDLDDIPETREPVSDDRFCDGGINCAEVRLVGTRRRYKINFWWNSETYPGRVGVDICTLTNAAFTGIAEHAGGGGLLKVVMDDVAFSARVTKYLYRETPTIADLFRHEPFSWGLRGDPCLWKEMGDHFEELEAPWSIEELKRCIGSAFEALTGASIDSEDPVFCARYYIGGMSSGHIDPRFWRTRAIQHLREQFEYDIGWKRPHCPNCDSNDVAMIVCGYPDLELIHQAGDRRLKLGGCCVTEDAPEWHCWKCEQEW
jgi:molybdenum cofactor cytidylyltransferase